MHDRPAKRREDDGRWMRIWLIAELVDTAIHLLWVAGTVIRWGFRALRPTVD